MRSPGRRDTLKLRGGDQLRLFSSATRCVKGRSNRRYEQRSSIEWFFFISWTLYVLLPCFMFLLGLCLCARVWPPFHGPYVDGETRIKLRSMQKKERKCNYWIDHRGHWKNFFKLNVVCVCEMNSLHGFSCQIIGNETRERTEMQSKQDGRKPNVL